MERKNDSWSIVIVGHWNKHLLDERWISKHILDDTQLVVEYPLQIGLPIRITCNRDRIRIIPQNDRLSFLSLDNSDDSLIAMERSALKIVSLLHYTPIISIGVNFTFTENIGSFLLNDWFIFKDEENLKEFGGVISEHRVRRRVELKGRTLFLTLYQEDNNFNFTFNYHYNIDWEAKELSNDVRNILDGALIDNRNLSEEIMSKIYNLSY
ncbi:hypothetical protein MCHI_002258 [Candidatus Magnetoovum chiemensis]|nr:hypothetical protein MCHI_002258 [Candidatus Magnetoovum chiemensis]